MTLQKIKKNNRGFVILFAVTLSSILLAIALGVANIALKEVKFGTSAKNTNNAFFAADTGAECALFYDKLSGSSFPIEGPATPINCASATITPSFSGTSDTGSYDFKITSLGSLGASCAKVNVFKDKSVTPRLVAITSNGYDVGDANCNSTNSNRVERELKISSALGVPPPPPPPSAVNYLIIAGGGGGGMSGGANSSIGAGGGAGGMVEGTGHAVTVSTAYTVTVGAGGANHTNGNNSVFDGITAIGGGHGGSGGPTATSGGSGGGQASDGVSSCSGAAATQGNSGDGIGFGFNGGACIKVLPFSPGGGGGASAVGATGVSSQSGAGGAGRVNSISGASVTYAGGGGGGQSAWGAAAGSGGSGGGGSGGNSGSPAGNPGVANRGGGGGGAANLGPPSSGGSGSSGIIIISYPTGSITGATGGTITTSGGNTIHTFTSSGTFTIP